MYLAMSIAATGLRHQQFRIDTIAHNVANVNTVAHKSARLDFKDALYTTGLTPGPPRTPHPEGNQQKGHGVMVAGIGRDFRSGNFETTNRPMDFAIQGEGFFSLSDFNGELVYTRNGSFHISVEEDGNYLVNGEGFYVLDEDGERIMLPFGMTTMNVGQDGSLQFRIGDEIVGETRLGIFTFRNLYGLESVGGANYFQDPAAGERLEAEGIRVFQGVLEMSNVNLAEEMTRLIRTQRAFQLASRALTTADDMEGIANNMRR